MPEIKTRDKGCTPSVPQNLAQKQMQRNYIRSKEERKARENQEESPSSYAEQKVSRTAEDAVRDTVSVIQNHHHKASRQSQRVTEPPFTDSVSPESPMPDYTGSPTARHQISEQAHTTNHTRQTLQAHPELRTRLVENPRPIKSRSNPQVSSSIESIGTTPARQTAAQKAAVQQAEKRIALRKQEARQFATEYQAQQMESVKQASPVQPASEATPAQTRIERAGLHNYSMVAQGNHPNTKEPAKAVPIKDKSLLPIRTKPDAVRSTAPTVGQSAAKSVSRASSEKAKKTAIANIHKSRKATAKAGQTALYAAKKAAELTAKMAKAAAQAASDLYAAIVAGGGVAILVIVVVVLIGCGAAIFGMQEDSDEVLPLSAEVEAYEPVISRYAKEHGIPDYVLLIQAVMMQESGGRGTDPMQASECGYNTQYPRVPGGITDPEYSISVGIQNLADCLHLADVESPIDLEHIQLALQGYNYGSGYISWAKEKYGGYSRANAIEFSMKMAEQMGWNSYGDKQYVPHVLRYYPIGRVFYTPEGGDAIVDVALTQVGNVGGEPYWSWYGFENHVEWCACFVSWCADQCGYLIDGSYPKFSGCVFGMQWFQQRGLWLASSTEPAPGMLIFFDWATQDGVPDHVGIVERVENGYVYTIEGNSNDVCRQKQYSLASSVILGYGMPAA